MRAKDTEALHALKNSSRKIVFKKVGEKLFIFLMLRNDIYFTIKYHEEEGVKKIEKDVIYQTLYITLQHFDHKRGWSIFERYHNQKVFKTLIEAIKG